MFDYLLGNIVEIGKFVVLDNSGIGYKIFCSRNSLMKLAVGERAKLFIYLSIKEDSHTLFGFASKQEREIFEYFIRFWKIFILGNIMKPAFLCALSPV